MVGRVRLVLASLLLALHAHAAADAGAATTRLPVVVHMAQVSGHAVAPPEFIAERIARANEIFAAYGVGFVVTEQRALWGDHAQLVTREDRDALAAEVKRGAIHCFVVASLRDVDEPERVRRGVHWHSRAAPTQHYVIVSILGGPNVLSHELGHFLGNPEHSDTPGNLMSYQHGESLPFLDAAQVARLRRALRGYLRRAELHSIPADAVRTH
jgi:hypothetical protein